MKKTILTIAAGLLMIFGSIGSALAENDITVYLEGKQLQFDVPPQIVNGYTMVPMRAIFETLGYTISWDDPTRTVTASGNAGIIQMTIDQNFIIKNGVASITAAAPKIIDSRTLIPLRVLSETIGYQVGWDDATRTVTIGSSAATIVPTSVPNNSAVTDSATAGSVSGNITSVNGTSGSYTLIVKDSTSNVSKVLKGTTTTPCLDGKNKVAISTLKSGDNVLASYQGDSLVSVIIVDHAGDTNTTPTSNKDTAKTNTTDSTKDTADPSKDKALAEFKSCDVVGYISEISDSGISVKSTTGKSSAKSYDYKGKNVNNVELFTGTRETKWSNFKNNAKADTPVGLQLDANGYVIEIFISSSSATSSSSSSTTSSDEVTGYFSSIDDETIDIKTSKKSSSKTYKFKNDDAEDVSFYYDGSSVTFSKFESKVDDDDDVRLVLNSSGRVTKVYAGEDTKSSKDDDKKSSKKKSDDGKISKLSSKSIKVGSNSYDLDDDDVEVSIIDGNSKIYDFDDLLDAYEEDEKTIEVTLTLDNGEVEKIRGYVSYAKGDILDIDEDEVRVEFESGKKVTYEFSGSVDDDDIDDAIEDFEDDDIDTITLELDENGKVEDFKTK